MLFYVRQKHQDLLTQLAVSIQGYLAIDIVIKNNIELIKGVDRASTTTVSALRTAVIVAQALGNQKLVLDQITALNTTTSGDDRAHLARCSRDNSVAIQQQAASATIGLPQLQAAFANIYATMDAIDTFKVQALDTMAATIGTLETEVEQVAGLPRAGRSSRTSAWPTAPSTSADSAGAGRRRASWGMASTCRRAASSAPLRPTARSRAARRARAARASRRATTCSPRSTGSRRWSRDGAVPAAVALPGRAGSTGPSGTPSPGSPASAPAARRPTP